MALALPVRRHPREILRGGPERNPAHTVVATIAIEEVRLTPSPPFPLSPGTPLLVRGRRVRLDGAVTWPDCVELRLSGTASTDPVRLLWPFDRPRTLLPRISVVRRPRARHLTARTLASTHPCGGLWCAAPARIDLMPFQLEPALTVVDGGTRRLLLADAVGLGKTIQAGLILAELHARRELEHALVVTPPGLRDQWATELTDRFGLESTIVDLAWLRRTTAEIGPDVNPWRLPRVAIASYDFLKRPEVGHAVLPLLWDAVVLDEAHGISPGTERWATLRPIAERARHVVLLTATPHAGDTAAFEALCRLGALDDDPLICFRRTRTDIGLSGSRRTHLLRITPFDLERRLHQSLARYASRVWRETSGGAGARLAVEVLLRRACSNPVSLHRSLERRLTLLQHADTGSAQSAQMPLPLDAGEEDDRDGVPDEALGTPGLADAAREQQWLRRLIAQAAMLPRPDTKLARIVKLLCRTRERAIVFTEYRDTLEEVARHLSVVVPLVALHGGLPRAERAEVIRRFTRGDVRVLLATDAAGEGLNLQTQCRLVVNLELPWSPRRLEQRAGRVDRLGQSRRVHVVNMVARGTNEERVLATLLQRTAAIRRAVGPVTDAIGVREADITEAMVTGHVPPGRNAAAASNVPLSRNEVAADASSLVRGDERARAAAEAERLRRTRTFMSSINGQSGPPPGTGIFTSGPHRGSAHWFALGLASWIDGTGADVERAIVAAHVRLHPTPRRPADWRAAVAQVTTAIERVCDGDDGERRDRILEWLRRRALADIRRHLAIAAAVRADARSSDAAWRQRGLFDHRAERLAQSQADRTAELCAACDAALARCQAATTAVRRRVAVTLLLPVSDAAGD